MSKDPLRSLKCSLESSYEMEDDNKTASFLCFFSQVARPGSPVGYAISVNGEQSKNIAEALSPPWKTLSYHHPGEFKL